MKSRSASTRKLAVPAKAKGKPLWKISILTSAEAEEAVSDKLQSILQLPVSSYTDVETSQTSVTAYVSKKPTWAEVRTKLVEALENVRDCGLKTAPGRISSSKVRREDWAESWKRHFKPIEINSALLIKPSWIKRKSRAGQAVVILDPGLSFGTGQHPTTSFCLQQLAARRRQSTKQGSSAFLDIGTGSGILAISAAKLGYAPVDAFDFDPEAVRIARENARANQVSNQISLYHADLTRLPLNSAKKYDLICANLISTLLVAERKRILNRLKPGGVLIVAGILASEFGLVRKAFSGAGMKLIASQVEKEWRSGAFSLMGRD
jgi:ribosomal protein L11 methyltransferase